MNIEVYPEKVVNEADKLMKTSTRKAIERSRRTVGNYKDVFTPYNTPSEMFKDLRQNEGFYLKWLEVTKKYIESGEKLSYRPTIDRVDEKGNYELSNMQALSYSKNTMKANAVKCVVVSCGMKGEIQCEVILGITKALKKYDLSRKYFPEENKYLLPNVYVIFIEEPLKAS
jgi:hypothetical protein